MANTQEDPSDLPLLMRPYEAARLLRLSVQRLAAMRLSGSGPRFIKLERSVLYARADVLDWLEARRRRSTSDVTSVAHPIGDTPADEVDAHLRKSASDLALAA